MKIDSTDSVTSFDVPTSDPLGNENKSIMTTKKSTGLSDLNYIPYKPINITGQAKKAYDYYLNRGVKPNVAAGIVGNLYKESGLNPNAVGDKGTAYGVAQWRGDRLSNLKNYAISKGKSHTDLTTQLDFILDEKGENQVLSLMGNQSPEVAAKIFADKYERPNPQYADYNTRSSVAKQLGKMKYGGKIQLYPNGGNLKSLDTDYFDKWYRKGRVGQLVNSTKDVYQKIKNDGKNLYNVFDKQYPTTKDKLSAITNLTGYVPNPYVAIPSAVINTGLDIAGLEDKNNAIDLASNVMQIGLKKRTTPLKIAGKVISSAMDLGNPSNEQLDNKSKITKKALGGFIPKYALGTGELMGLVSQGMNLGAGFIDSTNNQENPNVAKSAISGFIKGNAALPGIGGILGGIAGIRDAKKQRELFQKKKDIENRGVMDYFNIRSKGILDNYNTQGEQGSFYAKGGIPNPQYEVEHGEVIVGDDVKLTGGKQIASNLHKVIGKTHDQSNPNTVNGTGEDGQGGQFIFSNRLQLGGKTFANLAEGIAKQKSKAEEMMAHNDYIFKNTGQANAEIADAKLQQLAQIQEMMKGEANPVNQFNNTPQLKKGGVIGTQKVADYQKMLNEKYGAGLTEDGAWGANTENAYKKHILGVSEETPIARTQSNNKGNYNINTNTGDTLFVDKSKANTMIRYEKPVPSVLDSVKVDIKAKDLPKELGTSETTRPVPLGKKIDYFGIKPKTVNDLKQIKSDTETYLETRPKKVVPAPINKPVSSSSTVVNKPTINEYNKKPINPKVDNTPKSPSFIDKVILAIQNPQSTWDNIVNQFDKGNEKSNIKSTGITLKENKPIVKGKPTTRPSFMYDYESTQKTPYRTKNSYHAPFTMDLSNNNKRFDLVDASTFEKAKKHPELKNSKGIVINTFNEFGDVNDNNADVIQLKSDGSIDVGKRGSFKEGKFSKLNKIPLDLSDVDYVYDKDDKNYKIYSKKTKSEIPIYTSQKRNNLDEATDYGKYLGGKHILVSGKKKVLVNGSVKDFKDIADKLTKETGEPVSLYQLDNGAYNLPFMKSDKKLTHEDIISHRNRHLTSGGVGLSLRAYKFGGFIPQFAGGGELTAEQAYEQAYKNLEKAAKARAGKIANTAVKKAADVAYEAAYKTEQELAKTVGETVVKKTTERLGSTLMKGLSTAGRLATAAQVYGTAGAMTYAGMKDAEKRGGFYSGYGYYAGMKKPSNILNISKTNPNKLTIPERRQIRNNINPNEQTIEERRAGRNANLNATVSIPNSSQTINKSSKPKSTSPINNPVRNQFNNINPIIRQIDNSVKLPDVTNKVDASKVISPIRKVGNSNGLNTDDLAPVVGSVMSGINYFANQNMINNYKTQTPASLLQNPNYQYFDRSGTARNSVRGITNTIMNNPFLNQGTKQAALANSMNVMNDVNQEELNRKQEYDRSYRGQQLETENRNTMILNQARQQTMQNENQKLEMKQDNLNNLFSSVNTNLAEFQANKQQDKAMQYMSLPYFKRLNLTPAEQEQFKKNPTSFLMGESEVPKNKKGGRIKMKYC